MAIVLSLPDEAVASGVTWQDNVLTIPAKAVVKQPFTYSANGDSPFTIDVGAGARVTLLETLTTDKSANLGTTLILREESSVKLISVATQNNINIQRTVTLAGRSSSYEEHDVFYCTGQQGFSVSSNVINGAPQTKATAMMHGVLDHAAKSSCTGTMRINKGAQGAQSQLAQHVLLLSKDAKAENFPYLEIEENDVTAGHAATVRPLDEEQLFYLRSRGLPDSEARRILLMAFLTPFLGTMDKTLQERVVQLIEKKWSEYALVS
ncbi:MAG TPA: SufD family Fe-S cluster assembly protein [Candidatus Binatia bacterium]|nr:SufD family Fe-S cluster assembly protein [Candidatus Binatia bacterium]